MIRLARILLAALAVAAPGLVAPAAAQAPKVIHFATEGAFAPWNYTNPDGSLGGFEIELYQDLCKRAALTCDIRAQDFDGTIPALNAGKFDAVISGMSVTPKREEAVLFTRPYGSTGQTFAALKSDPLASMPDKGELYSLAADEAGAVAALKRLEPTLKGKTIGVQTASIAAAFVDKYMKGMVEVREYKTTEQHDLDLVAGRVDFVMASTAYLTTASKKSGNEGMAIAGPRFQGGLLGRGSAIAVRKGDAELKDKLDAAIQAANADGTIRRLSDKYFGYDVTPR
jgi:octopine/nopaline transport system substrate-binding protein